MRLNYHLIDVFTDRQFGGNQLAVFPDPPPELPATTMQNIAKELNLSETTFVFPPPDAAADFRLRIFTPAAELPMAGHPTVGSAYLLARLGALGRIADAQTIVFQEGVGPIAVTVRADETRRTDRRMDETADTAIPRDLRRSRQHRRDSVIESQRSPRWRAHPGP